MRELDSADLGILLSVFAVLLIFFGIDFRLSRSDTTRHRRRALAFAGISLLGNATTALALVLTWVAMFLPPDAEQIDTWLVFVPGSIAALCAVVLTGEVAVSRALRLTRQRRGSADDEPLD